MAVLLLLMILGFSVGCGERAWADAAVEDAQGEDGLVASGVDGEAVRGVAAGTARVLTPVEPEVVYLPPFVADRIVGPTALFYFSPMCPHCQEVMPEINALAQTEELAWLGVSTGMATDQQLEEFSETYGPVFPIVVDQDRGFVRATGARATPIVYLAEPVVDETTAERPEGMDPTWQAVIMRDVYGSFSRGMGAVLRMRLHPEDPFRELQGYQGSTLCHACHEEEARGWSMTHHAIAYMTLYRMDRAQDLQCVGCHVTGLGEEGGFVVGDHRSVLTSVTCEACHGPSGPHDGTPTDSTAGCVACHDQDHSIAFSVDKGLPHIDHFAAVGKTDAEIRERLGEMAMGEADRPLLAFPDGPTVGAKACKSCHKKETRAWASGPHGQAMHSLEGKAPSNPDCVECHATPLAMGPVGTAVEDYRVSEGVGCESCHGAAEAHVAAPTADNIVGLGERCPECVLEAICTSCHTRKWDPSWELKKRVKAIGH